MQKGKRKGGEEMPSNLTPFYSRRRPSEPFVSSFRREFWLASQLATNPYEPILASGETYLIGWDVLQVIAKHIGLVAPKFLTPTRTRKMYSIMCLVLDMNDVELT